MNENNKYIRFDWAIKHMLRDKENFDVLEGLITVLLNQQVTILEIENSESCSDECYSKFNRLDIFGRTTTGNHILIKLQLIREYYYLRRITVKSPQSVTDRIPTNTKYGHVERVISITLLYFTIGEGNDYVYYGHPILKGINTQNDLLITLKQYDAIVQVLPGIIIPEYYLVMVNRFDKSPITPLEEWIWYLKEGCIKNLTTVPGLKEAKDKLQCEIMDCKDRKSYECYLDDIMVENDVIETAKYEGQLIERALSREPRQKAFRMEIALRMLRRGMDKYTVAKMSELPIADVNYLKNLHI